MELMEFLAWNEIRKGNLSCCVPVVGRVPRWLVLLVRTSADVHRKQAARGGYSWAISPSVNHPKVGPIACENTSTGLTYV